MTDIITFEPLIGSHITAAAKGAIHLAKLKHAPVSFTFNGVPIVVTRYSDPDKIAAEYDETVKINHAKWKASTEGQEYLAKQARHLAFMQSEHDSAMAALPDRFETGEDAVRWVERYMNPADHIGVTGKDYAKVAAVLKASGFVRNDACRLPQPQYEDKAILIRWLLGQVIDQLESDLPPHAGMIAKFADKILGVAQ